MKKYIIGLLLFSAMNDAKCPDIQALTDHVLGRREQATETKTATDIKDDNAGAQNDLDCIYDNMTKVFRIINWIGNYSSIAPDDQKPDVQKLLASVPDRHITLARVSDFQDHCRCGGECLTRKCGILCCNNAKKFYDDSLLQLAFFLQLQRSESRKDEKQASQMRGVISVLIKKPFDLNALFYKSWGVGLNPFSKPLRIAIVHAAVMLEDIELLKIVLQEKDRLNLDAKDSQGYTAFQRAIMLKNLEVATLLAQAGAFKYSMFDGIWSWGKISPIEYIKVTYKKTADYDLAERFIELILTGHDSDASKTE